MYRSGWPVFAAVAVTALLFSVPPPHAVQPLKHFPDSIAYLQAGYSRPPTARLFYALLGDGGATCIVQSVLSVLGWTALGWSALGAAGAICAAALAASLPVALWNFALLSESLGLSLGAACFAATLALGRAWTWPRFALWATCTLLFVGVRVEYAVAIPFLGGALLAWHRPHWRPLCAVGAIAVACALAFGLLEERSDNWDARMTNIVLGRMLLDERFTAHFATRGLPIEDALLDNRGQMMRDYDDAFRADTPQFQRWLREDSRAAYAAWLATWAPHRQLLAAMDDITARGSYDYYTADMQMPGTASDLLDVYDAMRLPLRLWAGVAVVPLLCATLWRPARFIDALALVSFAAVYALSFVAYHGDAAEVPRHIALAAALYRMVPLLALGGVWERLAERIGP